MTLLWTIFWILCGFVGLVLLLLAIPMEVSFDFESDPGLKNQAQFVWLFGLVRVPFRSEPKKAKLADDELAAQRKKKPTRKKKSNRSMLRLIRNPDFRHRVVRLIRRLFKCIHMKDFDLRMRLGLDDPADTGQLWGFVGPVAAVLQNIRNTSVQLIPDFAHETFTYQCHGRVRLIPLKVVSIAAAFFLNPRVIHTLAFSK